MNHAAVEQNDRVFGQGALSERPEEARWVAQWIWAKDS